MIRGGYLTFSFVSAQTCPSVVSSLSEWPHLQVHPRSSVQPGRPDERAGMAGCREQVGTMARDFAYYLDKRYSRCSGRRPRGVDSRILPTEVTAFFGSHQRNYSQLANSERLDDHAEMGFCFTNDKRGGE